jgi:hypothetical protein
LIFYEENNPVFCRVVATLNSSKSYRFKRVKFTQPIQRPRAGSDRHEMPRQDKGPLTFCWGQTVADIGLCERTRSPPRLTAACAEAVPQQLAVPFRER